MYYTHIYIGIAKGHFQFFFASPEAVTLTIWKDIFVNGVWKNKLILVAVDEAHCISEWGKDFRPEFQNIEELRSLLQCPFMAVTATNAVRKTS